jgi:anti-sigma-K factor RskA
MTCAEFQELAAAMALGALDDDERAACEAHLRAGPHAGCHDALARAEATVARLGDALPPVAPPAALWDAIAAGVTPPRRRARRVPLWAAASGWVVAAAAAAALLVPGGESPRARDQAIATRALLDRCAGELETLRAEQAAQREAVALVDLPGTEIVALAPQGPAAQRATAIVNRGAGRAVVVGHGLVPQAGKDYELWVIRGDAKLAAGLLRAGSAGSLVAVVDPALLAGGVDAFAITLEPEGGSDSPRGPILLVGAVGKG